MCVACRRRRFTAGASSSTTTRPVEVMVESGLPDISPTCITQPTYALGFVCPAGCGNGVIGSLGHLLRRPRRRTGARKCHYSLGQSEPQPNNRLVCLPSVRIIGAIY